MKLLAEAATSETHALALVSEAAPVAAGVSMRTVKRWAVADESQVPDSFWILDESTIGGFIRAGGTIPGIRVWEETSVAAGTR